MTNQAAQTMPELPAHRGYLYLHNTGGVSQVYGYTAAQMHQYARDYAAALSQTAGVAEGWKLVPNYPTAKMVIAMRDAFDVGRSMVETYHAALAAAPAASGAHPDALQDGTLSKSTAKRVEALGASGGECNCASGRGAEHCIVHAHAAWDSPQPPSAAPVSERARELLADAWLADTRDAKMVEHIRSGHGLTHVERIAIRAIEQALTKQRGDAEPVAFVFHELTGEVRLVWYSQSAMHNPPPSGTKLYTTPQPSADAVRELVQRWRDRSASMALTSYTGATLDKCADELESLLSGGPHA